MKGFRDCAKNTEIESFQISAGLAHRAVTSSLPTLVLVVSYYLLSPQNSVYPQAPPTTPSPACLPACRGLLLTSGISALTLQ